MAASRIRNPVFHTGQPIGTLLPVTAASSGPQAGYQLTSTAASVGPYRLCSGAPVKRSHSRHSSVGSASPLQKTRFSVRQEDTLSLSSEATNAASIDGTKWVVVTPYCAKNRCIACGSRCASGAAITSWAPVINGHQNSHTETSKLHGVFCATTSAAVNG